MITSRHALGELAFAFWKIGQAHLLTYINAGSVIGEARGSLDHLEQMVNWLQHVGSPKSKISHVKLDWIDLDMHRSSPNTSFIIKR